jgi:hypothetical protein
MSRITVLQRFEKYVDKNGPMPAAYTGLKTRCHVWTGGHAHWGYGRFRIGADTLQAHVAAYLLFVGKVEDKNVLHKCDNPPCVNPDHLFLGTQKDNVADMLAKGRQSRGISHSRVMLVVAARGVRNISHKHPELRQGERNGRAKLTADLVREIRARYACGNISQKALADAYAVGRMSINFIVRGKRWRSV